MLSFGLYMHAESVQCLPAHTPHKHRGDTDDGRTGLSLYAEPRTLPVRALESQAGLT